MPGATNSFPICGRSAVSTSRSTDSHRARRVKALAGGLRWVLTFMQDHIGVEKVQPQRSPLSESIRFAGGQLHLNVRRATITGQTSGLRRDSWLRPVPNDAFDGARCIDVLGKLSRYVSGVTANSTDYLAPRTSGRRLMMGNPIAGLQQVTQTVVQLHAVGSARVSVCQVRQPNER